MAGKITLDFYQIYYKEEHLAHLYDFATPYYNNKVTLNFENDVIAKLVPSLMGDLIGVCSWSLRRKRGDAILRLGKKTFLKEEILNNDFDVAILTPRSPNHKTLMNSSLWHGKAWDNAFTDFKGFLKTIGIKVPNELRHAIYENHFIAKKEIYHEYVSDCLLPSIDYISNNPLYSVDSNYKTKKSRSEVDAYKAATGRDDWPIAPFILERLFSIWTDNRNYKFVNI